MAIAASSVTPTNSLEDFRIEFNNLVSDVSGITATNKFTESIIFEGATADAYETTLTVTDPTADRTVTIPNATGTVLLSSAANPTSSNSTALGTSALEWSDLYLADGGIIYFGNDQDVFLMHVADTGLQMGDNDKMMFGGSNDLQIYHDISNSYIDEAGTGQLLVRSDGTIQIKKQSADETMATFAGDGAVTLYYNNTAALATASAAVNVTGDLTATLTIQPAGDTAAGDNAAIGYASAEGLILTGQGSTNDVTIKNDADTNVISIPTGTSNVTIAGDLTISGDDLFMNTNTSGYILVADGTNYNPVAVSGDVTMSNAGAVTIASTAVEGSMLNNNVISGQTALTSGLATTDELLVSDAGTLKRVDVSLVTGLATGDATALAIALG